jgi:hypothetical protein
MMEVTKMHSNRRLFWGVVCIALTIFTHSASARQELTESKVKKLVTDAYIWGFAIVENYKGIYFYGGIDENSPVYTPFNTVKHMSMFYDHTVTTVVSGNNDTFYSNGILDLRAEPIVFHVPEVEEDRYYTFQLTSMTTDNFGYIGSRSTGTKEGYYAITGPSFTEKLPEYIKQIKSPSEFVCVIGRTAVYNKEDAKTVMDIQKKYKLIPLSKLHPEYNPKPVPEIEWPKYSPDILNTTSFFEYLNWLLQFHQFGNEEQDLVNKFSAIGVIPGEKYTFYKDNPKYQQAINAAIKNGYTRAMELSNSIGKTINGWDLAPYNVKYFGNNYNLRTGWAVKAIYVNDPEEAYYPAANFDIDGNPLNGQYNYKLHFKADELPPAKYFWSLTMYYADNKLMVENPIGRYSIGDRTEGLKYAADGSLTIYLSHKEPKEGSSNWLPTPNREWYILMRIYGPKQSVLKGKWVPKGIEKVSD